MKKYSIFAHALHSRLQLIRNKLDYQTGLDPSQLVIRNRKYFERASQSVEQHHQFRCSQSEFYEAAELFIMVATEEDNTIKNQPKWTVHKNDFYIVETCGSGADKDKWYPVTERMASGMGSNEVKKMSQSEAMALYRYMCKRGSAVNFRVSKYQPSTPTKPHTGE